MSQIDFVELFIKIIEFYGFTISPELVNNIVAKSQIKHSAKHIKPIIGIHFHGKCCVNNDQITKHCAPQYSSNLYGWTHHCQAYESKSIYLNNEFKSKACGTGTLKSTDHEKCKICGIFINFQIETFEEFVAKQYNKCYPNKPLDFSAKQTTNNMSITQQVISAKISINTDERSSLLNCIRNMYTVSDTELLLKMQEEFFFICCGKNSINNERLYHFCLSNICFDLQLMKTYLDINKQKIERDQRFKQKELCYL
eukprot:551337_1